MPALLLAAPESLAGKTTVAAALAQKIQSAGSSVAVLRLAGDKHAAGDTAVLAAMPGTLRDAANADVTLVEAPPGDPAAALAGFGDAGVVVVTRPSKAEDLTGFRDLLRDSFAGVIVNRVPQRQLDAVRQEYEAAGLNPLALLPEDRLLASPALSDVATALAAETSFLNDSGARLLDRPLIASISADPGQGYFARYDATSVIVRSDKPDLQLAALNAGAACLIVTGGLPILSYVLERAEEDEIPLIRTDLDTVAVVKKIESLFASVPFSGGDAKLSRAGELIQGLDITSLLSRA